MNKDRQIAMNSPKKVEAEPERGESAAGPEQALPGAPEAGLPRPPAGLLEAA